MMNRRWFLGNILGLLASGKLVLAADDKKEEAVKAELEKLQGSWQATSLEIDGEKAPEKALKEARFEIKDNKMIEKGRDNITEMMLDPTRKPKTVTLLAEVTIKTLKPGGKVAQTRKEKQTLKGIYTLEGATLTFCLATDPKADRPTKFKSGKGIVIAVFQCQKP